MVRARTMVWAVPGWQALVAAAQQLRAAGSWLRGIAVRRQRRRVARLVQRHVEVDRLQRAGALPARYEVPAFGREAIVHRTPDPYSFCR